MRYWSTILIICAGLFSCEEQFGLNDTEPSQKVIDLSREIFFGEVIEKSSVMEDDNDVWKIKLKNENGSIVSFYWQKNYNIVFKIVGEIGPFNYDMEPPLNVLPLSTARFVAFESYSNEILSLWVLKRDNIDARKWIYQFYINGNDIPFTIDATSGDIINF